MAGISALPVRAAGLLAWQWRLEGQRLKGVLLLHLMHGFVSSAMIWLAWWVNFKARRNHGARLPACLLQIEFMAVALVGLTGHVGGFPTGVNLYN